MSVEIRPLFETSPLPLLIRSREAGVDLCQWAAGHRQIVLDKLALHGGVLFRDFGDMTAERLEQFALIFCAGLYVDNGEHNRQNSGAGTYTPVFYPSEHKILWHNENSFNHEWPMKIWFCSVHPAATGGETPVVDSRLMYAKLPPPLRDKFEHLGVRYCRVYHPGLGRTWQQIFDTDSRQQVEKRCAAQGFAFIWLDDDVLRTTCDRPAVIAHPQTGEPCWFNQAQHWHPSCLDPETREALEEMFDDEELPRDCRFGDGSRIEDEEMATILRLYEELEVVFPWQKNDIHMLDNVLAAHARNAFTGERKLLVAMGDVHSYSELATA